MSWTLSRVLLPRMDYAPPTSYTILRPTTEAVARPRSRCVWTPARHPARLVGEPAYRSQAMLAPSRSGRYPGLPAIYWCRAAAFAALQLA